MVRCETRATGFFAGVAAFLFLVMALSIASPGQAVAAIELGKDGATPGNVSAPSVVATAAATSQLQAGSTSVSTADGVIQLGLDGAFGSAGKAAVLNRINAIRLEACKQGVPDPYNPSQKLTEADYVPIKWSRSLEMIARTRAAEGSICLAHVRPNGESCFTVQGDGITGTHAENLAWNYSGMLEGIEQWYEEKADWVNQDATAVTGHYTSLINPNHTHVGLGAFTPAQGGWTCIAGEFSYSLDAIDESEIGGVGNTRQVIGVQSGNIVGLTIAGPAKFSGSATKRYSASVSVAFENAFGGTNYASMTSLDPVVWKSSNSAVVSVDASGMATSKKCGEVVLTASSVGKSATAKAIVEPAAMPIKKLIAQKKALKVTWAKKASLAKGYEIRYGLKKSMKTAKVVKVKVAKKARVIKKLKSKKRYYVQIRSYAKVGGKTYYSAWSKKKSVKVK